MKIEISDLARNDILEATRFYKSKDPGLEEYFLNSIYADIDSLRYFSGVHEKVFEGFFRALAKRFPFSIYYTTEGEVVQIHAVVDWRRNPTWIKKHLRS